MTYVRQFCWRAVARVAVVDLRVRAGLSMRKRRGKARQARRCGVACWLVLRH